MALTSAQVIASCKEVLETANRFGGQRTFEQYKNTNQPGILESIGTVGDDKWALFTVILDDGFSVGVFPTKQIVEAFSNSGETAITVNFDAKGRPSIKMAA